MLNYSFENWFINHILTWYHIYMHANISLLLLILFRFLERSLDIYTANSEYAFQLRFLWQFRTRDLLPVYGYLYVLH